MSAHHRHFAGIFIMSMLPALGSGCGRKAGASSDSDLPRPVQDLPQGLVIPEGSPMRTRVKVEAIAARPVHHELNVPATAEADPAKMAKISPPLPGRVVKLFVRLGEAVKQGAPLFTLDSSDLVAAQTDYLKARSAEAQANRAVARQKDLVEHGIGAKRELEQAETERDLAHSELERAGTRLRLLGMDPGQVGRPLQVRAPVSGRIIDLATASGEYQNDPAAVLMIVADLSTIWVTANVPEKDIQRVAVGEDALIDFSAYPGQRLVGRVQFIGEVLAPETRSVKVRIELDNPGGRLKPGMFARVTLRGTELPELLVPPAALVVRADKSYLFVEKAPWTFERRVVEVGDALPEGTCIVRGLAAGERIVTANTIVFP
jgi:cobalt-zinc-cadmium efflux system membrane fusion protein